MPFDEPGRVVGLPEDQQGLPKLLDGVEGPQPEQVLLQGPDEALGTAIALGGPHEGGRTLDTQEGEFLLEGVGQVLAPVIVAHRKPAPDPLGKAAETAAHALADRLERLEAGWPGARHGCPRTRLSSDRRRRTPRPGPRR